MIKFTINLNEAKYGADNKFCEEFNKAIKGTDVDETKPMTLRFLNKNSSPWCINFATINTKEYLTYEVPNLLDNAMNLSIGPKNKSTREIIFIKVEVSEIGD